MWVHVSLHSKTHLLFSNGSHTSIQACSCPFSTIPPFLIQHAGIDHASCMEEDNAAKQGLICQVAGVVVLLSLALNTFFVFLL